MISKEKSEVIGLLCAEGCHFISFSTYYGWDKNRGKYYLRKNKRCERVDFSNTDIGLSNHFRKLLKKCYGNSPKYTSLKVMIVEQRVVKNIISYSDYGWDKWIVPLEVKKGTKEVKIAFIRGLYEGDGTTIFWRGKQPYLEFHMHNLKGLAEVQNLLLELDINSKLHDNWKKLVIKGNRDVYKFAKIIKPKFKKITKQGAHAGVLKEAL
jgi:intein/homing endonuclease